MIENIIYRNHLGEEICFGKDGIFVNSNDLHDFSWGYSSKNDRISSFKKGIIEKTVPVVIKCDSEEKGMEAKNKLYEITEKDVLAKQYGKIIIGDYYLQCYVIESAKSDYLIDNSYLKTSLKIISDIPSWIKETTESFGYYSRSDGKNLDYNNDFDMDYTSNLKGTSISNMNFVESNFKIIIYGECVNPYVEIAGHAYNVNVSVEENEYLIIDSYEKTIILTKKNGQKINCFNSRNKDSYIFKKIPVGVSAVSTTTFKFDVVLLEERGEPKWT